MTKEHLEWLPLSQPTVEEQPKPTETEQTCPHCYWPVSTKAEMCPHCERPLVDDLPDEALEHIEINLPKRIIEIIPPPHTWFTESTFDTPAMYDLRLQAERFDVAGGFEHLICLDDIDIEQYQHQLEAALHVLRDMDGHALLADEVGLGKTIEAGIVMKELLERGLIKSVLIITPAPLTWQWHEEMQTKFFEDFTVLEKTKQLPPLADNTQDKKASMPQQVRWIISLSRAKHANWAKRLLQYEYDLLIIDEAHKLRNHRTKAYQFVNQIRKRHVLMLTATPVHNHLLELYNLITILRPGHLGTQQAFKKNFIELAPKKQTKTKRHPHRRTIYSRKTYELNSALSYLRLSAKKRDEYLDRDYQAIKLLKRTKKFNEFKHNFLADIPPHIKPALDEIESLLASNYKIVEFDGIQWEESRFLGLGTGIQVDFVCRLKRQKQAQSEPKAPQQIQRHITPRNPATLRKLLREVMIRNRRTTVGIRFPPREAAVYHLNLSPPEQELYKGISTYIRQQFQTLAQNSSTKKNSTSRLALMTLQQQLCSSPQAVARSLQKLLAKNPSPQLKNYLDLANSIKQGRKTIATLDILKQYPARTLIFTDYLPTMHALDTALSTAGHQTILFHGGLSSQERVEAVRAFKQSEAVMISTHSGGEGHNLQFCRQLINYDLPWNPMRIEQRIGRIHRLGQKKSVIIFNLSANNTIEAYILNLLAHKIRMFELVIGELDLILGELDSQRSFEDYIREAWSGSQSEADLLKKIADLEALLGQSEQVYQKIRATSDELSGLLED